MSNTVRYFQFAKTKSRYDSLGERNSLTMIQKLYKVSQMMAFVPMLAMPGASLAIKDVSFTTSSDTRIVIEKSKEDIRKERAAAINKYYSDKNMPMYGKGLQMVLVAEKYGLDWRLLPAISIRESSGGRQDCGHNPFGWGSCKLSNFKSYDEAIETVGKHLGGANERTARYYAGKTTEEKLYYYNGSVEPWYTGEVLSIMDDIEWRLE